jgi:tetratricopeptide (TPR) repeat protein
VNAKEGVKRLFDRAGAIVQDEILLHERQVMARAGWFLRMRLRRALRLYGRVLELIPESWNSTWFMAKTHQRLGEVERALEWMERAYQVNASRVDIAREASLMAMDLGRRDAAIVYAHRATQIEKEDAGLLANLEEMIEHFVRERKEPPSTTSGLQRYWAEWEKRKK